MKTVVVVDPDDDERMAISEIVRGAGYRVWEAHDGSEGLGLLQDDPEALVVVAEESRTSALALLSALRQATGAPIVVVGDQRKMSEPDALSVGADYYCHRPLSPPLLAARIRSFFRRWPPAEADLTPDPFPAREGETPTPLPASGRGRERGPGREVTKPVGP